MVGYLFKRKLDITWIFFGFCLLILMLYPYWLWKDFSALGWYDELRAVVPWYFSKSILSNDINGFMHGYVGGNNSAFVCVSNNEKISLYRFLITHYDLWVAGILFRIGGFFLLFAGVYIYVRKVIQNPSAFLAFAISLATILVDYVPYGWTIGGIGWDRAVIVWLCVIFFFKFNSQTSQYFAAILISVIASVTCMPIFLIPSAIYVFIFNITVIHDFPIERKEIVNWSIIWLIFLIIMAINWYDALEHALIQTKDFSSRIQATLSPRSVISLTDPLWVKLVALIEYDLRVFYAYLARKPHQLLCFIYVVTFLLSAQMKLYKKTFIFIIFAFLLPPCFDVFFKISNINFLSKFEWSSLWHMQLIMFSFFIGFLLTKKSNVTEK